MLYLPNARFQKFRKVDKTQTSLTGIPYIPEFKKCFQLQQRSSTLAINETFNNDLPINETLNK